MLEFPVWLLPEAKKQWQSIPFRPSECIRDRKQGLKYNLPIICAASSLTDSARTFPFDQLMMNTANTGGSCGGAARKDGRVFRKSES